MKNVKECIFRMRKDMKNVGLVVIAVSFYLLIMLLLTGNTCIIRGLTGIPCPGCGMTRAFGCLLRGQWSLSFQMHPMLLPWLAYFLYLFVWKRLHGYTGDCCGAIFLLTELSFYITFIITHFTYLPN